jgi:hypothetical protein
MAWNLRLFSDRQTNKLELGCLTGETWVEHGKVVAAATPYLPASFNRPPQDPALKISSGYKAWEFLMYLYGLGPGIFYGVLPSPPTMKIFVISFTEYE